ncbi:hypothetical protein [Terricaulis sp.]|uniref:hypothetical protein n=1 Tax=Terricaulis sp. TaxID=2768686 RepID=UPI00378360DF
MFGSLVDGQKVEYGTLLLAEMEMDPRRRVLAIRVRLDGSPHCLVVPEVGNAFLPSASWLSEAMWDVTPFANFCVNPQRFEISNRAPVQGEIAYTNGDWLIPAMANERRPERLHWISVAQGVPIEVRGPLLRFPEWSLTFKDDHNITLFKHQAPAAAP